VPTLRREGQVIGVIFVARAPSAITISVSDTGIGIAPEDQAAIFGEFRQVGRDDARKQEGTGLGLTLAKKFVELHGGADWGPEPGGPGLHVQLHPACSAGGHGVECVIEPQAARALGLTIPPSVLARADDIIQ
jgi:signal transduction histidine kinase